MVVKNRWRNAREKSHLKVINAANLSDLLPGEETEFAGELLGKIRNNVERYLPYAKQLPMIVV